MSDQRTQTATPGEGGLLAIGFLALTGAVAVAHTSPATGYELSIYTATPTTVWLLLGVAFCVSLLVALETAVTWIRRLSLSLGASSAIAFVGMPILRGYEFISGGDALTHLGWARQIQAGDLDPVDFHYPGFHTVSSLLSTTVDIELTHAMMLVVVLLFALFFLFVALTTSLVFESRYSTTIGAFSAFLLLPVTTLSTHISPHMMSQAILFSAVVVYLFVAYVRREQPGRSVTAIGTLLAISLIALVLYHPQLAAHLLVAFVGICGLQFLYRRFGSENPIKSHRPIYGQTAILGAAFVAWMFNHEFIRDVIQFHLLSTIEYVLGEDGSAGDSLESQGDSLTEIGGSVIEVGLKILGPSLVFGLLVAAFVGWTVIGTRSRLGPEPQAIVSYLFVALVGLTGLFGIYFFGSSGQLYFRVFGFMLLFVTILGAVAIAYGADRLSKRHSTGVLHTAIVLGFGILLVVSLLAVFPSPYIYDNSPHVADQSLSGYATALDHADDDVSFVGIRSGPNRYADATSGDLDRTRAYGSISGEEIESGITQQYTEDRYLSLDQRDRDREVVSYQELRYTETQLDSIGSQQGVHRIQTNGELEIYYIRANPT